MPGSRREGHIAEEARDAANAEAERGMASSALASSACTTRDLRRQPLDHTVAPEAGARVTSRRARQQAIEQPDRLRRARPGGSRVEEPRERPFEGSGTRGPSDGRHFAEGGEERPGR
jgi:hypothetical protein